MSSKLAALLALGQKGPFRAGDLQQHGIPRSYLVRWEQQGLVERVARGLYRLTEVEPTALSSIAGVARRVRSAVVCLLTALRMHELTSEAPHAVWLMIPTNGHRPRLDSNDRLLYRLSQSRHRDNFVLKGTTLFSIWSAEFHRVRGSSVESRGARSPSAALAE